ncbi:O-antigen ligase family protein [Luteimonas changyuni]|uniref:O-antigen ligase family protein n=1 Tax=Luteimonas sp. MJ145 TaxID=3129234 RepID=UPI0031BA06EB
MLAFLCISLYLLLVLLRPQEYPQMVDAGIPLLPIALVSALLAWLGSREKRFDEPQYLILPVFVLMTSLSIALNGWVGGAVEHFTLFAPSLVAFVVLANTTTAPGRMTWVMVVFTASAALMAVHGVDQKSTGVGWTGMPLVDDGRIQYLGIFSDPNDLAMLFVICLPMAVYLASRGGLFGLRRMLWLGVAGLLLYGIYLTNSRGGMLAVAAMLGVFLWVRRGPASALVVAVAGLVAMRLLPSRLNELDVTERSASGRVEAWYEGIQMFIGSPLYGVGTGNFTNYHHLTAHNSLVLVLAENGVIGFGLWFAFIGYCFWMMVRILREAPQGSYPGQQWAWDDAATGGGGEGEGEGEGEAAAPAFDAAWDMALVEQWRRDRAVATALLVSLVGFAATAFFLSRSYIILLYLLAALVVAHFTAVRERFPAVPAFRLSGDMFRWVLLAGVAALGFYVLLRILLVMS